MTREQVIEIYGIDPDRIGKVNCGWSVIDGVLVVMTKDKPYGVKNFVPNSTFTNFSNFLYTSDDILNNRILYYHYAKKGYKRDTKVKAFSKQAQAIMDADRRKSGKLD